MANSAAVGLSIPGKSYARPATSGPSRTSQTRTEVIGMGTLARETRHAVRMLMRQPGFTAVAVATMALGIGATTVIFTLVDAVLLRRLPFPEPERLVQVSETFRPAGLAPDAAALTGSVSPANLRDWRDQSDAFEALAAYQLASVSLREADRPVRTPAAAVSGEFFAVLGAAPLYGRTLGPGDDDARAVLLGEALWRRSFGADPRVVGSSIAVDGLDHTVVGVMPAAVRLPAEADLWMPLVIDAARRESRGNHFLRTVGRLRADVGVASAQQQMSTIAARIATAHPDSQAGRGIRLVPLHEQLVQGARPALRVFTGAVGLVLLICCFNVSNLLLARAAARQRETAVRVALGAGTLGLARQFVTEGLLLAGLGGVAGVALAWGGLRFLVGGIASLVPRAHEVQLDARALLLTLAAVVASGIVFGLAPLRRAFRADVNEALKQGARGSASATGSGLLVAGQVAITTVLLVGAGLLLRSFAGLLDVDSGLRTGGVTTARLTLPVVRHRDPAAVCAFHARLQERVAAVPGVEAAGVISLLPLQASGYNGAAVPEGRTYPRGQEPLAEYRIVTPGYFEALGIPVLRGRGLTDADLAAGTPIALVNETLARGFWPDQDPVGRRLTIGGDTPLAVVGVVRDVRQVALAQDARAEVYLPAQAGWVGNLRSASLVVRARGGVGVAAALRSAVAAVDPEVPLYDVKSMDDVVATSIADRRLNLALVGGFAAVALLLAALGVYGVISYTVAQSTREIGIRMSLGAQRRDVFRLVVGQGALLAGVGMAVGLACALALTRLMSSLLFAVGARDPLTFAAAPLLLLLVALVACAVPALRATRVQPVMALRAD
jgi:putative ABC transport system permease protein